MLGIDSRAARAAWTVFLLALMLVALYYTRTVVLVFIVAILFAYVLQPLVNLVDRILPWPRTRTYSLAIVYALLIGMLILGGTMLGARAVDEANHLSNRIPELQAGLIRRLEAPGPPWLDPIKRNLIGQVAVRFQDFSSLVLPEVKRASEQAFSLLSSAVFIVLVPILGFFFLKDGKELLERALGVLSPKRRPMWEDIAADAHTILGQFIRALVILSLATLCFYSLFFGIIGLPYAVLLAAIAGALEFIPVFGPLTAAIAIVLVAVLSGFGHIGPILAFLAAYRIFQDYILSPHLMSSGVELHPLLVIFGVLAGEQIGGVPGMFLSIPAMAILRVIYVRVQKSQSSLTEVR